MIYLLFFLNASTKGRIEDVRLLLNYGADIDAADQIGGTALSRAILFGHHDILELLIERDVTVDQGDQNGETALMMAARNGDLVGAKLLLDAGANVNHNHTRWGVTPLMYS